MDLSRLIYGLRALIPGVRRIPEKDGEGFEIDDGFGPGEG